MTAFARLQLMFRRRPVLAGAIAMFALLLAAYAWSIDIRASWGATITGDEPFYLITTQSLLNDGNLELRDEYDRHLYESFFDHADGLWVQSLPNEDGSLLSPHNPGLPVLLIPSFALGGLLGAQLQMILIAALTFALAYVLALRITGLPLLSWLSTLAIALSASAFVYASEIYPEVPATLLLVASLLIVVPARDPVTPTRDRVSPQPNETLTSNRLSPLHAIALVMLLSGISWLGVKYVPLAGIVALYGLWRGTPSARLTLIVAGLISAAAYAAFHIAVYGHLTPYSVNLVYAGQDTAEVIGNHVSVIDRLYRFWGLFVDERFGIGRWAPVLLLVPLAAPLLWRAGLASRVVLATMAAQLLIAVFVVITMMGWWFPGRTLMTVFPLMAVPLTMIVARAGRRTRIAVAALAVYSLIVTAALAVAGHAREVVIAVNPYELSSPVFTVLAPLYPDYRTWTTTTWLLHAMWILVSIGAIAAVAWHARRPTLHARPTRPASRPISPEAVR